jgi:rhamnosyltransferase
MKNIFIIGSKGIPARYGGFETFVDNLTKYKKSDEIKYYVTCMSDNNEKFCYNKALCFNIKVKNIGSAKAILYDIKSLITLEKYIRDNHLTNCIIYILACRIGPFLAFYKHKLNKLGIKVYVNPDGNEWKRSKWNYIIKKYWKYSEKLMVKYSDLLICDSFGIKNYILKEYSKFNPKTIYISYGADLNKSTLNNDSEKLINWYKKFNIKPKNYYLIVGRFVPENNYKIIIEQFLKSKTDKDLVIITNIENNKFYKTLLKETNFKNDKRIKFVGTVYESELLKKIRENAYAYIHGHEVGGTNPSLLEALAYTKINLLLNVVFNNEVAKSGALYFNKDDDSLSKLIESTDRLTEKQINELGQKAYDRIKKYYSWDKIVKQYENLFLE